MKRLRFLILLLIVLFTNISLRGQQKILQIDIQEEINPAAWRTVKKSFELLKSSNAKAVLIHLNTYGGMLDYADSIRTTLLNSPVPSIVFIDNNAASAGALISIACDKIYMQKGATIGAASVVNGKGEVLPEKYQSYMRGLMRTTAQAKQRDARIAEAFVDPDIKIDSLNPKGKVLTLTTEEAMKSGYCNAVANNIDQVLKAENLAPYQIIQYSSTLTDKLIAFLINPAVSSVLILLMLGGIYFEMQSPGIGFALLVAITAAALFFAPLYLEGLADNWEILLFLGGIILIALEIFLIPGFGIAGILGITFMIAGLALSMILNDYFDLSMSGSRTIGQAFLIVLGALVGAVVLSSFLGGSILKSSAFQRLVLKDEQKSIAGYQVTAPSVSLLGKSGVSKTDLRPSGKIIVDDKWYDAVSIDGYLEVGTDIVIAKIENFTISVIRKSSK